MYLFPTTDSLRTGLSVVHSPHVNSVRSESGQAGLREGCWPCKVTLSCKDCTAVALPVYISAQSEKRRAELRGEESGYHPIQEAAER